MLMVHSQMQTVIQLTLLMLQQQQKQLNTVTTGESATPIYIGLGVMLAAAGVYFLTRKKKEA